MEENNMDLPVIHDSAVGLDVHGKILVACYTTTDPLTKANRHEFAEFDTFEPGLEALAKWVLDRGSHPVMMGKSMLFSSIGLY